MGHPTPERMPAWFLAHGAPTHLLGEEPVRRFWGSLADRLPRTPRAILCLSAHWLTDTPALSGHGDAPAIQHDFHGFPEPLYRIDWRPAADAAVARWMRGRLADLLGTLEEEPERPLDHGTWVPLLDPFPAPPFPVYQLSLCPGKGMRWHLDLGRLLAPLRDQGVLLIGSGGIVHNLSRLDWQAPPDRVTPWAGIFMDAVEKAIGAGDLDTLCAPLSLPSGSQCLPTVEHYLPLLTFLGSAADEAIVPLHREWAFGCLSLHSYGAGSSAPASPEGQA
ncbi:MAG TPA: dioxygenase [Sedimenticola thiotaurini]|uniref:Dioxygenase n=1 Tax=Sedimenticola thiotaurini TaxID=1543721 RepID=A0A831RQJ5_9GAMM|nr:dioxygenase [Sedimenticola thiotaurini]